MATTRVLLGCTAAFATVVLAGCGRNETPPPQFATVMGGADSGTPVGHLVIDAGILIDQTTYRPATGGGSVGGADAESQVRDMVNGLVGAFETGDTLAVFQAFGEEAAALEDALRTREESQEFFVGALTDKFGTSAIDQLRSEFVQEFRTELTVEKKSPDRVEVGPNLFGRIILGPVLAPEVMTFVNETGEWEIRVVPELTDTNIEAINQYHDTFKDELISLGEAIEAEEITSLDVAIQAYRQILAGELFDLEQFQPAEPEEPEVQPAEPEEEEPELEDPDIPRRIRP